MITVEANVANSCRTLGAVATLPRLHLPARHEAIDPHVTRQDARRRCLRSQAVRHPLDYEGARAVQRQFQYVGMTEGGLASPSISLTSYLERKAGHEVGYEGTRRQHTAGLHHIAVLITQRIRRLACVLVDSKVQHNRGSPVE